MSSDDSRRSLLDEEHPIQLALLWDVPRLRATGDPDAEAFIASFGPLPEEPLELPETPGPLLAAAAGIRADRAGDGDAALRLYDRIPGTFWRELLRLCLRAWSATVTGTDDIAAAAERIERLPRRSDTRALLSVKLATFAYDKGDRALFARLLRGAVAATRPNTRLRTILTFESINFLGERPRAPGSLRGLPQSRLADRDWIDAWALEGAQEFFSESVADHARDPWSGVIRVGQRPLDRIVAAEAQATWAGALWQRRALRRQLGAQLLLSDPSQPAEAAQGLWQWFSSGGRDHTAVVSLVEPVLDRAACDWLIQALASRVHPPDTVINTVARVAISLWDCVSEELIPRLLSFLPAQAGDHPLFADNRRVWALMSIRSPHAFAEGFVQLDAVDQVAFAGDLSESALSRAVPDVRQRLLSLLAEAATRGSLGEDEWRARILLERTEGGEVPLQPLDLTGASSVAIVDAAQLDRHRVEDADLERAVEQLTESVRHERAQAHEGTYGIGGRSAAQLLAAGIGAFGQQPAAVEALWETALDEGLVGDLRLQALAALASLATEGRLTPDRRGELRSSVLGGDRFGFLPVSGDLLRAARLLVLAAELDEVEEVELMVLGRSRDVRARELAVNAGGLALARSRSERLDQVVLTALFDPNEGVIRRGLAVLRERDLSLPAADEVVGRRLVELMQTRRKRTRAAAVEVAKALSNRGHEWAVLRRVLMLAAEDKSWQVNQATVGSADHGPSP